MRTILETKRLLLRKFHESDIDDLFELDSDPEVHRYLGNKPVHDKQKIKELIEFILRQYHENGIGRWATIEKETGEFIGWSGLKLVRENINNHINFYDIGYRFKQRHWGKGYATESAIASLNYAFETLDLNELFAAVHVENAASNRVVSKIGLKQTETFMYDDEPCNWYRISRDQWLDLKSDQHSIVNQNG